MLVERPGPPPSLSRGHAGPGPRGGLAMADPHRDPSSGSAGTHLSGHLAVIDPPQSGEIGRFCTVEAVIESGVVAVGKRDHELPGLLCDLGRKRPTGEQGQ